MSKRLPIQRQPRSHPSKAASKMNNPPPSTELDPKMLNISAGGHFYERAKSRRNRHREVFASTRAGRAITNEAVPLGSLKRKNSGGGHGGTVKEALARLKAENDARKRNRSVSCAKTEERAIPPRDNNDKFESKSSESKERYDSEGAKRKRQHTTAADRISNNKKHTSSRDIIDLTD